MSGDLFSVPVRKVLAVGAESARPKSVQNPRYIASQEFIEHLELLFPQINPVALKLEALGFTVTFSPNDVLTQYGPRMLAVLSPEDLDCLGTFYAARANNDITQSYFNLSIHLRKINKHRAEPVYVELRHTDPPGRSKGDTEWLITNSFVNLDIAFDAIQARLESIHRPILPTLAKYLLTPGNQVTRSAE